MMNELGQGCGINARMPTKLQQSERNRKFQVCAAAEPCANR